MVLLLRLLLGKEGCWVVAGGYSGFDGILRGHVDLVQVLLRLKPSSVALLGVGVVSLQTWCIWMN